MKIKGKKESKVSQQVFWKT